MGSTSIISINLRRCLVNGLHLCRFFYPKSFIILPDSPIHAHIHTLNADSTMQDDGQLVRSS